MSNKDPVHAVTINDLIDRLVKPSCKGQYCILKLICTSFFRKNPRNLIQMKCIEIMKWEENKGMDEEMTFEAASVIWIEKSYAEAFADIYDNMTDESLSSTSIEKLFFLIKEKSLVIRQRIT